MRTNKNLLKNNELLRGLLKQGDLLNTINGGVSMTSVDMKETENAFIIKMSSPTVSADAFNIILNGNQLIIYSVLKEGKKIGLPIPMFSRTFEIPEYVDADKIEAFRKNGEIKVILPFNDSSENQPRTIKIKQL